MSLNTSLFLVLSVVLGALIVSTSFTVYADDYDCETHAMHIDKVIGTEQALDAYHILYGDHDDDHNMLDAMKEEHPDLEHELEEFVSNHCSIDLLKAHADDSH